MTGLERLVHTFFGSTRVPSRYLTLFYGITLGLALVLAFFAIYLHGNATPSNATTTQVVLSQIGTPTRRSTQVQSNKIPTYQPAIPPTPIKKRPSFWRVPP